MCFREGLLGDASVQLKCLAQEMELVVYIGGKHCVEPVWFLGDALVQLKSWARRWS